MTTLYKKVGRRYRPIADPDAWDAYHDAVYCKFREVTAHFGWA